MSTLFRNLLSFAGVAPGVLAGMIKLLFLVVFGEAVAVSFWENDSEG